MEVENLDVWNCGIDLAKAVYEITADFPKHEMFGIVNQMRRAAVSIPSNIAESKGRNTSKDFVHFLHLAKGSLNELQTQCVITKEIEYIDESNYHVLIENCETLRHKLSALIRYLKKK